MIFVYTIILVALATVLGAVSCPVVEIVKNPKVKWGMRGQEEDEDEDEDDDDDEDESADEEKSPDEEVGKESPDQVIVTK